MKTQPSETTRLQAVVFTEAAKRDHRARENIGVGVAGVGLQRAVVGDELEADDLRGLVAELRTAVRAYAAGAVGPHRHAASHREVRQSC